jgi:hypothetical protein
VPKVRIGPDENISLRYSVPDSGLVEFDLTASRPVRTYIVRPKGLELFEGGGTRFKYYGGFPDARKQQHQTVRLPFEGTWYLLIINDDEDETVTVEYDVYY